MSDELLPIKLLLTVARPLCPYCGVTTRDSYDYPGFLECNFEKTEMCSKVLWEYPYIILQPTLKADNGSFKRTN
jgi:hypothetical protein